MADAPHQDVMEHANPVAAEAAPATDAPFSKTEPGIDPEMILDKPLKADRSKPVKFLGYTFNEADSNLVNNIKDGVAATRFRVLKALPRFIVNNSSNFIGTTQLIGEAVYFKSSGVNKFIKDEHRGTWKAFVYPPINVVEGVFTRSAFHVDWKQMANPRYMGGEVKRFFNLKEAARVDFERDGKLGNSWSARSGFSGMTTMAITTALPEEKDTPEKTEKMTIMARNNPIGYVGYRLAEGVTFPFKAVYKLVRKLFDHKTDYHIGAGKRSFAGLGMMMAGFFSILAGFRQPGADKNGILHYMINPWQTAGGIITTFAGGQLIFSVDNEQGWTRYGATQLLRLFTLPPSISTRFGSSGLRDPNAGWYLGAQCIYQLKNIIAVMIGGAQKLEDGTLLDYTQVRKDAKEKAAEIRSEKRGHEQPGEARSHNDNMPEEANDNGLPATKAVANGSQIEKAMPERVAAHAAAQMAEAPAG